MTQLNSTPEPTNEMLGAKLLRKYRAMPIAERPKWQGPHCDKCGTMLLSQPEVMTHVCELTPAPQSVALQQLTAGLKACNSGDEEHDHSAADQLLLDYINDPQVTEAYDAIDKYYA
jgi:hypothetical protein